MYERTSACDRIACMQQCETSKTTETNASSVRLGVPVWVQCPGFRCLAYQDAAGGWRTFFRGETLSQAVPITETTATEFQSALKAARPIRRETNSLPAK
jgi:hypothetical protein